jgi:hypothetical protein
MKKVLVILAAAATAMILFSCDKQQKKEPKVYETPIYTELAAKYEFAPASEALSGIRSLELAPSGLFILEKADGEVKTGSFKELSRKPEIHSVEVDLLGFGKAVIIDPDKELAAKGSNVVAITLTPSGQPAIEIVAEAVPSTTSASSQVEAILGHSFKVTATELVISDYKISKTFEGGCDIPEILKYLEGKIDGFKADKDYSGFKVKDVTLTDVSFIVRFANQKDFSAGISIDSNNAFSYKVSGEQVGNPIFNGEANGKISFDKWNEPIVSVSAKINDKSNKEYNGSVKFYLSEVEAL